MKRIFFGFCWFLFFWLGVGAIWAGVMGAIASRQAGATTFSEGSAVGQKVGEDLGRKYGRYFLVGGLLVSVLGTATGTLPGTRGRKERNDSAQQAIAADRADERRAG
jgi:hypothetical protein